jgi:6-phosphogluconolactonase
MIQVFPNIEYLFRAAADAFCVRVEQAVERDDRFSVVLAGGSTPRGLYLKLGTQPWLSRVPWEKVHVFWGDERCVPLDDPQSNAKMAIDALLDQVPIPRGQIHPIDGTIAPAQSAVAYEQQLRTFFAGQDPKFDLVLLGMGDDGHTASLFPGTPALRETQRWVTEGYNAALDSPRVTMTATILNQARMIIFLVAGADKAATLNRVLHGPRQPFDLPAQSIQPDDGELIWMLDAAAAAQ